MLASAAALCVLVSAVPIRAQTIDKTIVSQYGALRKANAAANVCVREVGKMQVERNDHYNALLGAKTREGAELTIGEISEVLAEIHIEDTALSEKRNECMALLDQVVSAAADLRQMCEAHVAKDDDMGTAADGEILKICQGSANSDHSALQSAHFVGVAQVVPPKVRRPS